LLKGLSLAHDKKWFFLVACFVAGSFLVSAQPVKHVVLGSGYGIVTGDHGSPDTVKQYVWVIDKKELEKIGGNPEVGGSGRDMWPVVRASVKVL
jgi:hypothetical protein